MQTITLEPLAGGVFVWAPVNVGLSNLARSLALDLRFAVTTSSSSSSDGKETIHASSNEVVTQVIYRNNGMPFRTQDWDRLRKIAEGNPDETKVG